MSNPSRPVSFYKMHGLGNDFVVIDVRAGGESPSFVTPARARAIGDRHFGVGFDQLVVISEDPRAEIAARMTFWNPDGGTAGACGNATRCVADVLMRERGGAALTLSTEAADIACERLSDGRIRADMGRPRLDWREIPLRDAHNTQFIDVKLGPIDAPVLWGPGAVNMGNPHCVFFVDDAEAAEIEKLGPMIEHHPMFPERTNVEFAQAIGRDRLRLRVWERGAGITLACGSGACAAVVAGVRRGLCDRRATVVLDGGALEIEWSEESDRVFMTGPTQMVFAGALTPDFLATADESGESDARRRA